MTEDVHVRIDAPLYLRRDLLRLALFIERRNKEKRFEFLEEEKQKAFLEFAVSIREIHKEVTHLKRVLPAVMVKEIEIKETGEAKIKLREEDTLLGELRSIEEQLKGIKITS